MSSSSTARAAFRRCLASGPHLNPEQAGQAGPVKHLPLVLTHPQGKEITSEGGSAANTELD